MLKSSPSPIGSNGRLCELLTVQPGTGRVKLNDTRFTSVVSSNILLCHKLISEKDKFCLGERKIMMLN